MLADFYSMADYSTTVTGIQIRFFRRVAASTSTTCRYKVRLPAVNTNEARGLAITNTRRLIPPPPLEVL